MSCMGCFVPCMSSHGSPNSQCHCVHYTRCISPAIHTHTDSALYTVCVYVRPHSNNACTPTCEFLSHKVGIELRLSDKKVEFSLLLLCLMESETTSTNQTMA